VVLLNVNVEESAPMKRGLKPFALNRARGAMLVEESAPMKRGLKLVLKQPAINWNPG